MAERTEDSAQPCHLLTLELYSELRRCLAGNFHSTRRGEFGGEGMELEFEMSSRK